MLVDMSSLRRCTVAGTIASRTPNLSATAEGVQTKTIHRELQPTPLRALGFSSSILAARSILDCAAHFPGRASATTESRQRLPPSRRHVVGSRSRSLKQGSIGHRSFASWLHQHGVQSGQSGSQQEPLDGIDEAGAPQRSKQSSGLISFMCVLFINRLLHACCPSPQATDVSRSVRPALQRTGCLLSGPSSALETPKRNWPGS